MVPSSDSGYLFPEKLAESIHNPFNERGPYSFGFPEKGSFLLFSRDGLGFFIVYAKSFRFHTLLVLSRKFFRDRIHSEFYPNLEMRCILACTGKILKKHTILEA